MTEKGKIPLQRLNEFKAVVTGLVGWRRRVLAVLLGVLAVAALPPAHVWPLFVPTFVGLFWLVDSEKSRRGAFTSGWLFGFGFFAVGLYWIANAFAVRGGVLLWLGPFAVSGLAALLACFPALATLATRLLNWRGIGGVLVFGAAWTGTEWLRGWVLTGFPWNLVGTAWTYSDAMIQMTSITGTYGLSLLTFVAATMPATLADTSVPSRKAMAATLLTSVIMVACWLGGIARLQAVGEVKTVPDVRLRLVQPNIPQDQKWQREALDAHLLTQLRLGAQIAPGATPDTTPTHIVWSETAAPLFLAENGQLLDAIGRFTPRDGLTIIGTLRRSQHEQSTKVWNSLHAVDDGGEIVGTYDKFHLVPFGEYVPFRSIIPFAKFTAGNTDFSRGAGRTTLHLPGLPPVSPLICYEVIFPGRVTEPGQRPDWLLNLTNDAWYGLSAGPYQHFASARLRAVEEGLPLVRVANTGISAIVDPIGRVVARLGLGEVGVVDGPLPRSLASPTIYARFGDWSLFILSAVALLLGWRFRTRS